MMNGASYYDIDDILSQEELVPVNNLLDFTYLASLDPDFDPKSSRAPLSENESDDDTAKKTDRYLKEGTRFKMPLWSIEKWAEVGFVRTSLPKHFGRKARERYDADPVSVDLRKINERFFMSGISLVDLMQKCVRRNRKSNLVDLSNEALELKKTLLLTYTGARMRRTLDWTLSHIEDDVSAYTQKLTEMEMRLFQRGAAASHAYTMWKLYGSRRIHVSETALRTSVLSTRNSNVNSNNNTPAPERRSAATVSPDGADAMIRRKRMRRA